MSTSGEFGSYRRRENHEHQKFDEGPFNFDVLIHVHMGLSSGQPDVQGRRGCGRGIYVWESSAIEMVFKVWMNGHSVERGEILRQLFVPA